MNRRDEALSERDLKSPKIEFQEPWQAQAFALAHELHQRGVFSWSDWTRALGEALREEAGASAEEQNEAYYHGWVTALERLVTKALLISSSALAAREAAWVSAYQRTPHGEAVELHLERP